MLLAIKCKEITVSCWWNHSYIFDIFVLNIDESRNKKLKIKVQVHKFFVLFEFFRYGKFKLLFIPSFTNPTNVFKYFW